MIIVIIIAVIIVGPKDIPKVIVGIKKISRAFRNISIQVQSAFDEVVNDAELKLAKKEIDSFKSDIIDIESETNQTVDQAKETIADLTRLNKNITPRKVKNKTSKKVKLQSNNRVSKSKKSQTVKKLKVIKHKSKL